MHRRYSVFAVVGVLLASIAPGSAAAPESELWERWTTHDPTSTTTIDHSAWTRLLGAFVKTSDDRINRVGYREVTADDRQALEAYVRRLTETEIGGFNRTEQRAFWINLYNALTIKVVLDHYPVESILDIAISPGWFQFGPWDRKLIEVEGEELSLNDIEHRILRPIWNDPRIHYAVNCASNGCPNLHDSAFTSENTEALLERAAPRLRQSPAGRADHRRQAHRLQHLSLVQGRLRRFRPGRHRASAPLCGARSRGDADQCPPPSADTITTGR